MRGSAGWIKETWCRASPGPTFSSNRHLVFLVMPSDDATPHLHSASLPTGFHPSPSPPPDAVGNGQRSIASASISISGNQSSEANLAAHQIPFSPRSFDTDLPTYGVVSEPVTLYPQVASPLANPRHTPRMSDVAANGFPAVTSRSSLIPDAPESPLRSLLFPGEDFLHSNFVQSGIVHLPPLESAPETWQSSGAPSTSTGRRSADGSSVSSGQSSSSRRYRSNSSGSREAAPHMTLRFQHYEDENGHHVILGREGKLARCEDEVRLTELARGFQL